MSMNWLERMVLLVALAFLPAAAVAGMTATTEQEMDPAVQSVADGQNAFAMDLYGQLRTTDENLFFSPYSVDGALGMVRAGASGATADEMTRTLKLPDMKQPDLNTAMAALSQRFSADAPGKGYELNIANAMWGQEGESFLPDYISQLRTNFDTELNGLDFHKPGAAAAAINQWVALKTKDRIKNLISAGAINDQTKLILTNAIYFKGNWTQPFKNKLTHDAPWNDGTPRDPNAAAAEPRIVSMMFQSGAFDYVAEDGLSALQMPYAGGDLAMLIVLPDDPDGLGKLEKTLDADRLKEIVGTLRHEHKVEVYFPKFKLETSYELSQTLAKMGMPTVFSRDADLSGINGRHDLSVTGVVHKAFVQVDEAGTEAAAATAVMVGAMAMQRQTIFTADHPFVFLIRDLKTGTILFMGRVVHPAT